MMRVCRPDRSVLDAAFTKAWRRGALSIMHQHTVPMRSSGVALISRGRSASPTRRIRSGAIVALLVGTAMLLLLLNNTGRAQESRPATAGDCALDPVTVPLFGGTPAAVIAATPAGYPRAAIPAGDRATIEADVSGIVTCINTGDPSFQYSIFTPRYLAAQFVDQAGHYQPEFEFRLDSPAQPTSVQFELVSIEDLEEQADGRLQVTLVLRANQDTLRDTLLLARVDGHWVIDDVVALDPAP